MGSSPITSWQIDGETMETVRNFIFGGSKITADDNCSNEIKRCLLLGRKVLTNLDSIFGEGNGNPLQYSCLENPMDGGAWWAAVHGVARSWTLFTMKVSDFHFLFSLSRLVIAFLPRSKCLLSLCCSHHIQWFWSQENKVSHRFHCLLIYLPWNHGTRSHDFHFWMPSFKPAFSLSCFTFIKKLFSPSSLSAIWVLSFVYLRLLLFLPAILISACASSNLECHIMCSASNLNKQGYNSEPVHCCMVPESVSIPKFFVSLFLFIFSPTSLWTNW